MPIDASLLLANLQPLQQVETPMQARAQALENQQRQLQVQTAAESLRDKQAFRTAMQQSGGDVDKALQVYAQFSPEHALDLQRIQVAKAQQQRIETDAQAREAERRDAVGRERQKQFDVGLWQAVEGAQTPEEKQSVFDQFTQQAKADGLRDIPQGLASLKPRALRYFGEDLAKAALTAQKPPAQHVVGDALVDSTGKVLYQGAPKTTPARTPTVGTFEDYVTRTYGASPTPAQILKARKEYQQADDRATGFAAGDVTKLAPAAVDLAALNYKRTGVMPPLGMGDKSNRQAILNRAAALTPEDVQRIESGGGDIAANKATYAADAGSLKKLQAQRDAIGAFENTAQKNIDIFLETAGKVADTGSPLANSLVRNVSAQALGSPDVSAFNAARQVAINEIAKITNNPNLSGTLSDSARHEIEAFNPANATLKQSVAVMRVLKRDMANRKSSIDDALAEVKGRIGGGASAAAPTSAPAGGGLSYQDYLKSKGGK